MNRFIFFVSFLFVATLLAPALAQAQTDGIFADFTTTAGAFTVELDYMRAPRTVAHFIGLAEGGQSWMDPVDGVARSNAWLSGSAFYQVQYDVPTAGVTNLLALQGGLRPVADAWTGDPGYGILDETSNGLSHSNGVLSMVADGPNTGAAEFMILLTNGAGYWDGRQTVFGRVSAGLDVVQTIAGGGQTYGQLHAPATISNVTIRREGTEAEGFAYAGSDLPMVRADGCRVEMLGGDAAQYVFVKAPQSETIMAHVESMLDGQWALYSLGFNRTTQSVADAVSFSTTLEGWGRHFFHGTRVDYPVFSAIPLDEMTGITFAAQWSDGAVYQYWLNLSARTGFYQNVTTPGAVVKINDCQFRTRRGNCSQLNFMDQNGNVFDYTLGFAASGVTTGRYYLALSSAFTGASLGEDWGDCEYAAWNSGGTSSRHAATKGELEARAWVRKENGPVQRRGVRLNLGL